MSKTQNRDMKVTLRFDRQPQCAILRFREQLTGLSGRRDYTYRNLVENCPVSN